MSEDLKGKLQLWGAAVLTRDFSTATSSRTRSGPGPRGWKRMLAAKRAAAISRVLPLSS